ncbi:Rid family hydrolase [Flavisphingomonas formosensis]|uniref:Rid family hydrolase n=1 Tax=Flavisphingomonas formosensis TaxID=861534 RepID=UPI0012FC2342|nr:Rid family hydrolase [Sphingomonas formosensis]
MTEIVKVKTGSPAEERGAYSRLIAVDNLIFVSLTAGRNPRTKLIPEDPAEQTLQVLSNIDAALAAVGSSTEDIIAARVFVQFQEDIDAVMAAYAGKMRGINPTLTLTSPPLGMAEFKVEIEVTAYRGAAGANVKEVTISL